MDKDGNASVYDAETSVVGWNNDSRTDGYVTVLQPPQMSARFAVQDGTPWHIILVNEGEDDADIAIITGGATTLAATFVSALLTLAYFI